MYANTNKYNIGLRKKDSDNISDFVNSIAVLVTELTNYTNSLWSGWSHFDSFHPNVPRINDTDAFAY